MSTDSMLIFIAVLVVANVIVWTYSALVRSERRRYDPDFVTFAEAAAAPGRARRYNPNFVISAEAAAASGKPTDAH